MRIDENGDEWYSEKELKDMFDGSIAIEFLHMPPDRPRVISVTVPLQRYR